MGGIRDSGANQCARPPTLVPNATALLPPPPKVGYANPHPKCELSSSSKLSHSMHSTEYGGRILDDSNGAFLLLLLYIYKSCRRKVIVIMGFCSWPPCAFLLPSDFHFGFTTSRNRLLHQNLSNRACANHRLETTVNKLIACSHYVKLWFGITSVLHKSRIKSEGKGEL